MYRLQISMIMRLFFLIIFQFFLFTCFSQNTETEKNNVNQQNSNTLHLNSAIVNDTLMIAPSSIPSQSLQETDSERKESMSVSKKKASSAPSVNSGASQQKATMEVKKMEFSSSKGQASSQRSQRSPTQDQQVQMNETVTYFESFAPESFEYHYFKYVSGNYTIGLVDHLFKAEKLKPNNADVQIQLASYYIITGDRLNSVKYLAKLKAIDRISDVSLKYAKDVLLSVPENGVLITHGFDDTYACEYLQLLDNQRTDVTIISLDFLQSREYAKKLKEKGFNVSESTVIDVTYFTALCNQNEAKKISISLTTPKEYFKSIQTNLFVVGLVFEYHSNQFNNYYKNDYLWNEVLEKSLVYFALNEKGKEISSNYLPMLLQLRTFYIQNDEVEKLKEIEIALDKVSVQSKKYDKVQKLKKSY